MIPILYENINESEQFSRSFLIDSTSMCVLGLQMFHVHTSLYGGDAES